MVGARLAHCTPVWGGHSPACMRDGTYCLMNSAHSGPCAPHGSSHRCDRCGEPLRYNSVTLCYDEEVAEIVGPPEDPHLHLIIHVGCMQEGDELA